MLVLFLATAASYAFWMLRTKISRLERICGEAVRFDGLALRPLWPGRGSRPCQRTFQSPTLLNCRLGNSQGGSAVLTDGESRVSGTTGI